VIVALTRLAVELLNPLADLVKFAEIKRRTFDRR
jgi:hypothetical protein